MDKIITNNVFNEKYFKMGDAFKITLNNKSEKPYIYNGVLFAGMNKEKSELIFMGICNFRIFSKITPFYHIFRKCKEVKKINTYSVSISIDDISTGKYIIEKLS